MAGKKLLKDVKLTSVDDIFKSDEERQADTQERIAIVSISELHPFPDHPFKVQDDDKMLEMVESVKSYGVLTPLIARPCEGGGYELVAGHRRCHAAELAGLEKVPVLIREMDDDTATILMVDTNLQRESILPSEKAFAYKMKLEAMKRQGQRTDLTSRPVVGKSESADLIGDATGESGRQVQRYIRLTELEPPLLDMVDDSKLAFRPAVEISYLNRYEQTLLLEAIEVDGTTPSLGQATKMKKFSQDSKLSAEVIESIMGEEKPLDYKVTLKGDKLKKYFPPEYTPRQMEEQIIKLLEGWQKNKSRDRGR